MNLSDLLNPNFKPRILEGGSSVELKRKVQERNAIEQQNNQPAEEKSGFAYVKRFRRKLEHQQQFIEGNRNDLIMEIGTNSETSTVYDNQFEDVDCNYDDYNSETKLHLTKLPIDRHEREILNVIDTHQIVILEGNTGCGKSTRVPQYILDSCVKKNQKCRIIVTQPRRLGVISVATRVANERDWPIGGWVGYHIGQDKKSTDQTRIIYCTTGVMLEKLVGSKSVLRNFTHIILDEVHEREQDMDFLLIIIKKLLNSSGVRIILMSATINALKFSHYLDVGNGPAPIIKIGNKTNHAVYVSFLDDLDFINPRPVIDFQNPGISSDRYNSAVILINQFDEIDVKDRRGINIGSVLIFLPGIREIEELFDRLNEEKNRKWTIKILHSSITSIEQETVFVRAAPGYRKIILSTNIAESSVTIPDITYIIDFCLTKQLERDDQQLTDYSSLKICWASQSNCQQRLGRVGRTEVGYCFRLLTKQDFYRLKPYPKPEILRMPLSKLVLNVKILNMGPPSEIFASALDKPDIKNIVRTIYLLKEIGALLPTANGRYTDEDGDLTFLGRLVSRLPVDIHLGKLIFFGYIFGVLEETIIIASAMSKSNLFSTPFQKELPSYISKLQWSNQSSSDCIAFLNAYQNWRQKTADGSFSNSSNLSERRWAEKNFIQIKSLREIARIDADIRERLERQGILDVVEGDGDGERFIVPNMDRQLILKAVIAGAFYPNYFVRNSLGGQINESDAVKMLCGSDPNTTVYLKGLPDQHPGYLYWSQLKEKLKIQLGEDINYFSSDSSKIFVHFKPTKDDQMGNIPLGVYKAIKLRQTMRNNLQIRIYNLQDAIETKRKLDSKYNSDRKSLERNLNIPWPWDKNSTRILLNIRFYVSNFENPSHFWIQNADKIDDGSLTNLNDDLNKPDNLSPIKWNKIEIGGKLYAGTYRDNTSGDVKYYRCRLMAIDKESFTVYFVDYGNTEIIPKNNLKEFGPYLLDEKIDQIPDFALECKLAKISPGERDNFGLAAKWSDKANSEFRKTVGANVAEGKIYSFVDGIVLLKIFLTITTLNKHLTNLNLAKPAEESYIYRLNHDELKRLDKVGGKNNNLKPNLDNMNSKDYCPELNFVDDMKNTDLKGPFSPLEMNVYGRTQSNKGKHIQIEQASVNSVLLDTDPHDSHERMVTAGYVHIQPGSGKLFLRDVTLMPNIHGFSSLMCLLFSPMVELRTNESMTKYIGALCGLGYHPVSKNPIHPINDMEIIFDCKMDENTLMDVNNLRSLLNSAIVSSSRKSNIIFREQQQAYELLKKIICDPKKSQDVTIFRNLWEWDQISHERYRMLFNNISQNGPAGFRREVYKFIWGIKLDDEVPMLEIERQKMLKELNDIANGLRVMPKDGFLCQICNVQLDNTQNLRLHKRELEHKKRSGLLLLGAVNSYMRY